MADIATDAPAGAPMSIEEEIRAEHEALNRERKPKDFPLPGYRGKIHGKYRVLSYDEISDIADKITEERREEKIDDVPLAVLCDQLIQACVEILVDQGGELVPLAVRPGYEGAPVRWGDERMARLVGLDPKDLTARQILRAVLTDDALVVDHGQAVSNWMEKARRKADVDFEPASPVTPE